MTITAWRSPTVGETVTAGDRPYTGLSDAFSQNGTSATVTGLAKATDESDTIRFRDFGFSVPSGARIVRIHVELDSYWVETVATVTPGSIASIVWARRSAAAGVTGVGVVLTHTTTNDSTYALVANSSKPLFDHATITAAEANNAEFGIQIKTSTLSTTGTASAFIDHIRVAIEYEDPLVDVVVTNPDAKTGTLTDGFRYGGYGTPQAQNSTTSGTAQRVVTGSGTPTAQAATVSGVAARAITGNGTPASQAATVSGSGTVSSTSSITGSGAPQAQASTVSGTATRTITGSGTLAANDAVVSGTGLRLITGTGSAVGGSATTTGVALRVITGTGTLQAQSATVSGYDEYTPSPDMVSVPLENRRTDVAYENRSTSVAYQDRTTKVAQR